MRVAIASPVHVPSLADLLPGESIPARRVRSDARHAVTVLVRALHGIGLDVRVVTLSPGVDRVVRLGGPRLAVTICPARSADYARDGLRLERRHLETALAAEEVDLIHAHWTGEYALAALHTESPALVTARDWGPAIVRWQRPRSYWLLKAAMQAVVCRRAHDLSATSPYLAARIGHLAGRPVAVLPNLLDPRWPLRSPRRRDPGAPLRIVAVNHGFSIRKNVRRLLVAFATVRRQRQAALDLVGDGYGPGGPAWSWAESRGLTDGVTFSGVVDRSGVAELLGSADVLVHPSLEESFGGVVLEAMASGLPVVGGARSGAVPWLLSGGRAGVLVDVRAPGAIARAVIDLADDERRRLAVAAAGRERAEAFAAERLIPQVVERYASLL